MDDWVLALGVMAFVSGLFFHLYVGAILRSLKKTDIATYKRLLAEKKDMWIDRPGATVNWSDTKVVWRLTKGVLRDHSGLFLAQKSRLVYVLCLIAFATSYVLFILALVAGLLKGLS